MVEEATKKITKRFSKPRIFIIAAVGLLAIAIVVFVFVLGRRAGDSDGTMIPLYFFSAAQGRLVPEVREVHALQLADGELGLAVAVFSALRAGPSSSSLQGVVPSGGGQEATNIGGMNLYDGVFTVGIFENQLRTGEERFRTLVPMTPVEEAIFRAAVTLTMTGLPYVDTVEFLWHDGIVFTETAATVANAPFISHARRNMVERFTLFFACESGDGLFSKVYEAENVNVHIRYRTIVEQLIAGQTDDGVLPLIPPETRVRDVSVDLEAGIYVDLSSEFHSRFSGNAAQARQMLLSITHTLLANSTGNAPRRVFFLIESTRREDFHGVTDFDMGFVVDETAMADFVSPEDDEEGGQ